MFENFVKKEVAYLCKQKGFSSKILNQKKFTTKNGEIKQSEEIDFIWETKSCIVLGELKCMDYPFTSRITYNNLNYLKKASAQIKRKKNFLIQNKDSFSDISFSKKIIPCIITNYPCFSGLIIDDIPVIDLGLFNNYISVGGIGNALISSTSEEITIIEKYYNNEDEFSKNIETLISKQPYLQQLKKHYKKINKQIRLNNTTSIIYDVVENINY